MTTESRSTSARPLDGRVILVTGATGGLGRVACRTFADAGATVLLLARNEKRLDVLYDELVAAGAPTPVAIPLDLAKQKDPQFEELAQTIEVQLGRLDGIAHFASQFVELSALVHQGLPDWERAFAVNTLAPFALTRACLPLLQRSPDASVLFCCEAHALAPAAFWGGFSASQSGLVALMRILADEYRDQPQLRFNLLVPGAIETPMRERSHPGETRAERRPVSELAPLLLDWLGPHSRGSSGTTVRA
ncbi:MAG: SDR family NAD(P)-dependent oxidoreductase [Pseudomonadota bacterium]|nr:SDR family NAD(P)-dependent oxidoreductase [Pseudomonadota bacterium]